MISIIVPIYKVENFIHRCIDSILTQTYEKFELILVDDGSPDNCGYICDEYAKQDNRVVVIHKENGGLSSARNAGLDWAFEHSNSEWVTFIDSDDWVHPLYLEALFSAVSDNGYELSLCFFLKTDGSHALIETNTINSATITPEELYCEHNTNSVVAWGKLYSKRLFRKVRYPVGILHEDEFVTYKLLFQLSRIAYISQPLYYFFENKDSITRSRWTPARLSALKGKQEQIRYMRENGFEKAYKQAVFDYAQVTFWQIREIKRNENYTKENHFLRSRLKRHLIKYNNLNVFSRRDNREFYREAFPVEMTMIGKAANVKSRVINKYRSLKFKPQVMNSKRTINFILKHKCSVARCGDGEYQLMCKIMDIGFQNRSDQLSECLFDVLKNPPDNLLLCVPNVFGSLKIYNERARKFWLDWNNKKIAFSKLLYYNCKRYKFGDALFTRPYIDFPDDTNEKKIFPLIKELWDNRNVLIVEGEQTRLGVGNDLLDNAKSIQRILAPATNAFEKHSEILAEIKKHAKDKLVLLALGPTATVLACELSRFGFWAVDIGHIDIEYEWYLRKVKDRIPIEGKYTHEVIEGRTITECDDSEYNEQIIKVIK